MKCPRTNSPPSFNNISYINYSFYPPYSSSKPRFPFFLVWFYEASVRRYVIVDEFQHSSSIPCKLYVDLFLGHFRLNSWYQSVCVFGWMLQLPDLFVCSFPFSMIPRRDAFFLKLSLVLNFGWKIDLWYLTVTKQKFWKVACSSFTASFS